MTKEDNYWNYFKTEHKEEINDCNINLFNQFIFIVRYSLAQTSTHFIVIGRRKASSIIQRTTPTSLKKNQRDIIQNMKNTTWNF